MKVFATGNFEKHIKACPIDIQKRANVVFQKLLSCKKLNEITSLEKLTGYKRDYYRIRIGHYRLGFELIEDQIELLAIMHRKEIYRFFP
jgi:mRNA interferase RelE/StbE